jgi:SPP1 family predicted phage head-tail adaptor
MSLTAGELAAMRAAQNAALPDTCVIRRVTLTPDSYGGHTEEWNDIATVACRVAPSGHSPQEQVIAERMSATSTWTLTLPADTDVTAADRLVVGARTFEVAAVLARSFETARRVVCTEVL